MLKKIYKRFEHSKIIFVLINFFVSVYFFVINYLTPRAGDDIGYMHIAGTSERVTSIKDIVQSQYIHYFTWGGRSVVHFIDQFFLMNDEIYFWIANTIVFLIFVLLIYKYVWDKEIANSFLLLVYIALWFSLPGVGSVLVETTMSCNYLWGTTIILLFLYQYWRELNKKDKNNSVWKTIYMFIFGIFAGWTLEVAGGMMLLTIMLIFVYKRIYNKRIQIWEISGFLSACIGFCFLIFAPGNSVRASHVESHGNIFIELAYRFAREMYYMIVYMGPLLLINILLFLLLSQTKNKLNTIRNNSIPIAMFVVAIVGNLAMTASCAYATRILITPIVFSIISCGILYRRLKDRMNKEVIVCLICGLCVIMFVQAAAGLYQMQDGKSTLIREYIYTRQLIE